MVSRLRLRFQATRIGKALFIGGLLSWMSPLQRHHQSPVTIFNLEITISVNMKTLSSL